LCNDTWIFFGQVKDRGILAGILGKISSFFRNNGLDERQFLLCDFSISDDQIFHKNCIAEKKKRRQEKMHRTKNYF
jgi:hypothetical protein